MKKDHVLEILKKEYGCWSCGDKDCIGRTCASCDLFVSYADLMAAIGAVIKLLEGVKDDD